MNARFDQTAGVVNSVGKVVVEFVARQRRIAPLEADAVEGGAGVDIAVGVDSRRRRNACNITFETLLQFGVGVSGQEIGGTGNGFVDQSVPPRIAFVTAGFLGCDAVEVVQCAAALEFVEGIGDGFRLPYRSFGRPKRVVDSNMASLWRAR